MLKANSLCSNEQLCVISYKDDISEINSMYVQLTFIYLKGLFLYYFSIISFNDEYHMLRQCYISTRKSWNYYFSFELSISVDYGSLNIFFLWEYRSNHNVVIITF